MKKTNALTVLTPYLIIFLIALTSTSAWAVPDRINYQGKLTDAGGVALDGTYSMRFYLFDAEIGGSQLWNAPDGEEQSVLVGEGIYNVQLGSDEALNAAIFSNDEVWLEIAIYNADTTTWETLSPRQRITSTAYAFVAENADNAATLEGMAAGDFAPIGHDHDSEYVNEGQPNSITSAMIIDSTVTAADLGADSVGASEIAANAVGQSEIATGAVASVEVLDNSLTAADLAADSVGASEIAAGAVGSAEVLDNSLTAADLAADSVGASEIAANAVGASEIAANAVGASEIAANAVGVSEINFSLDYTGSDLNGGLVSMINTANGSGGNYPAALYGGANGSAGEYKVMGVMGTAPALGASNTALSLVPQDPIGVAGAAQDGYGVVGTSTSHYHAGVYAESTRGYGLLAVHTDPSYTSPAVGGKNEGSGVGVLGDASSGSNAGVLGRSTSSTGRGVQGTASDGGAVTNYGGYFEAAGSYGRAVEGHATSTAATTNYGGRFQADGTNGYGVYGYSPTHYGVYGYGGSRGIYGYTTGSASEYASGVYGYASSGASNGYGGYFTAYGTNAVGIYAYGGASGYAADFRGVVRIRDRSSGDTVMELGSGLDYAEGFDVSEKIEIVPGTVLIIDPENPGKLKVCSTAYDTKVAGIVAGAQGLGSGVRLGASRFDNDVALAGRVYCNVDASRSAVKTGDLLTTADLPGYAMKADDYRRAQGAILGKAMEDMEKGRKGQILVLVTLQ